MSKKMKGVSYEARFKRQTLVQNYLELQKETEASRYRLEVMKLRKQTLEAEVRFLRRRHKFLLKTKSSTSQLVKSQNVETTQYRKSKKEKVNSKKVATLPNLLRMPNLNQKGAMYTKKQNSGPSRPYPIFDVDQYVNLHGVNRNQRVYGNNLSPVTEFREKESGFSGEETVVEAPAPIFDLNQISMEEQEESFEGQRKDQQNDLKLSLCRNVGDNSTNRSGKRKISWQDPVALRV